MLLAEEEQPYAILEIDLIPLGQQQYLSPFSSSFSTSGFLKAYNNTTNHLIPQVWHVQKNIGWEMSGFVWTKSRYIYSAPS